MAYVRYKIIKGHVYYYLVEGHRDGHKVRQKVIKYLGKNGGWGSSGGISFRGFPEKAKMPPASLNRQQKLLAGVCEGLGYPVDYSLSKLGGVAGQVTINWQGDVVVSQKVSFTKNPTINTMCHEIGHMIDISAQDRGVFFSKLPEVRTNYAAIRAEFRKVGISKYSASLADNPTLIKQSFFTKYAFTDEEGFANVFALAITDYKRALFLAPIMTPIILNLAKSDELVRKQLERLDIWELGTTER
ncbi:MAG: hypothetical protein ACU0A2_06000 [Cognatishimia sp.]|uniref:hypothetical protein n=1 Tax=Cognatishimia sp. TaxID=2211648 RepID=UPI004059804C